MNTLRIERRTAPASGIMARLRTAWRTLIAPDVAMAGEPTGAVEASEGWLAQHRLDGSIDETAVAFDDDAAHLPGHVAPSHAEQLLRSACDLLCSQPEGLISATSVSLPPEPGLTACHFKEMALLMAIEYGLLADVSVKGDKVHVRLTQRTPGLNRASELEAKRGRN